MSNYGNGHSDGWNEALDGLIDRLKSADETLTKQAADKHALGHDSDYDRLRGKVAGVRLALSFAREMVADTYPEVGKS